MAGFQSKLVHWYNLTYRKHYQTTPVLQVRIITYLTLDTLSDDTDEEEGLRAPPGPVRATLTSGTRVDTQQPGMAGRLTHNRVARIKRRSLAEARGEVPVVTGNKPGKFPHISVYEKERE